MSMADMFFLGASCWRCTPRTRPPMCDAYEAEQIGLALRAHAAAGDPKVRVTPAAAGPGERGAVHLHPPGRLNGAGARVRVDGAWRRSAAS